MVGILDDQEFLDGTERTRNSDSRELAKAFRDAGVSVEIISEKTKRTPEEIKAL